MRRTRRIYSSIRRGAIAGGGVTSALAAIGTGRLAGSVLGAYGRGAPFQAETQLGPIGTAAGAGIGAMFGQPFLGAAVGGAAGSAASAFFGGQNALMSQMLMMRATTGFTPAMAMMVGTAQDPARTGFLPGLFGPPTLGQQAGGNILSALGGFQVGGASMGQIAALGSTLGGQWGEQGAVGVGNAASAFASNPIYSQRLMNLLNPIGAGATGARIGSGDIAGMVLSGGLGATVGVLGAQPRLREQAIAFGTEIQRADYAISGAGAGMSAAGSRFAATQAGGALPGSGAMTGAASDFISSINAMTATLQRKIADLTGNDPNVVQARQGLQAQVAGLGAQAAQFNLGIRMNAAGFAFGGAMTGANIAGSEAQIAALMHPGGAGGAFAAASAGLSSASSVAASQAANASLPWQYRQQQAAASPALRLAAIQAQQAGVMDTFGVPALLSGGQSGRELALAGTVGSLGFGASATAGFLDSAIASGGRDVGRQSALLGAMERSHFPMAAIEGQRDALFAARLSLQTTSLGRSNLFAAETVQYGALGASVGAATASFGGSLGLNPQTTLGLGLSAARSTLGLSGAYGAQAEQFTANGQSLFAAQARNAAQLTALQAGSQVIGAYGSYAPAAGQQLRLSNIGLAEQIAGADLSTGGQVPISLRRENVGLLSQALGGLDARIAQAPAGIRDQVALQLQGQRAGYLLQLQQERQAMQFGDIGHAINVSSGTEGLRFFEGGNLAEFQRINPTGSRAFGGTGTGVGLSPVAQAALRNPAQALGGTGGGIQGSGDLLGMLGGGGSGSRGDDIVELLTQILAATKDAASVRGIGPATSPVMGAQDLSYDPRQQAVAGGLGRR